MVRHYSIDCQETHTQLTSHFIRQNPPINLLAQPEAFAEAMDFVAHAQARFVFLALGSPVQELLAQEVMRQGRAVGLGLCIGAAMEFAAGTRRRAPGWLRRAGLEWLPAMRGAPPPWPPLFTSCAAYSGFIAG